MFATTLCIAAVSIICPAMPDDGSDFPDNWINANPKTLIISSDEPKQGLPADDSRCARRYCPEPATPNTRPRTVASVSAVEFWPDDKDRAPDRTVSGGSR